MILANYQLFIIYIILILSLLVIAAFKSRTTIIIAIILSNLVTILFYSIAISNPQIAKELIIITIIYSIVILTLILNSNHIYIIDIHEHGLQINKTAVRPIIAILTTMLILGVFYLAKNINQTALLVREKQIQRQNEIEKNPLIFPGHPSHINVKKYYLGKNPENKFRQGKNNRKEVKELYSNHYKKILKKNIIFKRLSEVIIVIMAAMIIFLLYFQYKSNRKNIVKSEWDGIY